MTRKDGRRQQQSTAEQLLTTCWDATAAYNLVNHGRLSYAACASDAGRQPTAFE